MTPAYKAMCSVWNSILPWVLLCLFSSGETADSSHKIILDEQYATSQEESHITINCKYIFHERMQLLWIKDPKWNATEKEYYGIIVYSNTEKRPQASEYSDRVEFLNDRIFDTVWTKCTLKINHLKKSDSGKYAFRYIGGEKYMGSEFELMITDYPCNIHIKPRISKTLKEGDAINLSCTTSAACETHPKWQWSDSSEDLITEHKEDKMEKYSELKYNVSWTDDGRTLTCRPSRCNSDDCVKRSVTLRVEYSPKQTRAIGVSNFKDVKEGEQVTISCSSNAHPKANFTWFKRNGSFSQPGENLTFLNMTPEKGGMFYCQAKNEYGTNTSLDININIIYVPKGVNISPTSMTLAEGYHLALTCTVRNSNPAVKKQSYRWYKDGQEIDQQTGNTFTLPSVKRFDTGSYQCQARNSVGETMSTHAALVNVEYVPQNTIIRATSRRIKLNLELHLECVTEANPPPNNYSWYFKREHKQTFLTLSHMDQVYRVKNVAVSDAGSYTCSAHNTIGSGANSAELNVLVLYPPKQPNLTMKHVAREYEDYHITCTVESSPQSELTLTRNDKTLKNVQSNFLKFSAKVSPSDAGVYTCLAKNSEGENSTENHLKVLYAPKDVTASAYPSEELKEGADLTLSCKADSVPQVSNYTWTKSGTHPEKVGHGQEITLHSLKSSDSGNYNCISSNEIGIASSSPIYIRVKYQPRITLIHNMTLLGLWEKLLPIHLSCSVQCYPPATSFAWYKLEENTTVLSVYQNYTVQPENPGTYYCFARNDVGHSTSEPLQIYLHHIIIKRLVQVIISLLVILSLIGVIFLLHSIFLKKRKKSSGNNEGGQNLFSFSAAPLQSLFRPSGLRTNTRENLVMEGSAFHSNPPANNNRQAERPNHNIHTVYDAVKLPPSMPKQHHYTEEDLTMTTVNYAAPQFKDGNNPNKSASSNDDCIPVYAKVLKNKQIAQEQQGGHEDYENMFAACALKQTLPNIDWDSDSSESEDEVNYTKVSITVIPNLNPRKDTGTSSSDEEGKIEYTEVKI